jgi:hypothetical protein
VSRIASMVALTHSTLLSSGAIASDGVLSRYPFWPAARGPLVAALVS